MGAGRREPPRKKGNAWVFYPEPSVTKESEEEDFQEKMLK